jgi:hypothetical protein
VVPEEVLLIEEAISSQLTRGVSAWQGVTRSCTACGCGSALSSGAAKDPSDVEIELLAAKVADDF